ncbi:hypothetical protein [Mycoplasma sp. P36-A1]|uniref:hypothetical protein n=1 Tax=Mycoplasma sp. P36-A1 TaxID=3252900 RepID=UPI003C2D5BE6
MFNKKGFMAIEMMMYITISILCLILLNLIINQTKYITRNQNIYIYQNIDILQNSLIKYKEVKKCSQELIELDDTGKIIIKNNTIYESPGYLPYLQNTEHLEFICYNDYINLKIINNGESYEATIFYKK